MIGNRTTWPNRVVATTCPFSSFASGHAQPRAVGERQIEEISGGTRIRDDGRIEPNRDHAGAIDFHGLALDLELDGLVVHAQEAAGHAVAVDQPDDLGGPRFASHAIPELVE